MLISHLLRTPVTIVRPTVTTDRYGTPVFDWNAPQRTEVMGELQPKQSGENSSGRTMETVDAVLYLLPGAPLAADDRIEVGGSTYYVVGPPLIVSRRGVPHHLMANVTHVEG